MSFPNGKQTVPPFTRDAGAARLPRDAAHPPLRGEGGPALRHGPDRRLLPPLHRPGGRGGRHADGHPRGRSGHHHLSRPRPHAGLRHGPQGRDGRADRPPGRLFARQGRLDAHVLQGEELLRRARHRRRQRAARSGPGLRQPVSRQRQPVPHLLRRRRRQPGPGVRELQHGQAVEAAGGVHHREQQVRHGHLHRALGGDHRLLPARPLVRHPGRAGRRHGRARGQGRRRPRGASGCAAATAPTSWRC